MNNNNSGSKSAKRRNRKKKAKSASSASNTTGSSHKKLVHISKAASEYARALANPFNGPLATVPKHPAQLTRRLRTFARTSFDVQSSNGHGWISMTPRNGITNDVFVMTGSLPTGTNANWFNISVAADRFFANANSEFAAASLGNGENQFECRLVSAALRIRYIGTELNRGGQVIAIQDQNHMPLTDRTLTSIDGEVVSRRFAVTRDWIMINYSPVSDSDLNFYTAVPGAGLVDYNFMGFAIQGPTGVSCPFEVEAFSTYEIFGKNVRGMTNSVVDATGFSAVHTVTSLGSHLMPSKVDPRSLEKKVVAGTAQALVDHTSHVSNITSAVSDGLKSTKTAIDLASTAVKHSDEIVDGLETAWDIGSGILDFLFG